MKRALALSGWIKALMDNGALLAEKPVVQQLVVVFLSGTKEAWLEVCFTTLVGGS